MQQVRQGVARARLQVEYLQGALDDLSGEYERSFAHYQAALTIAHELNDASDVAHVQHHLALLSGRRQGLAAAADYYQQAMTYYEGSGNLYRLYLHPMVQPWLIDTIDYASKNIGHFHFFSVQCIELQFFERNILQRCCVGGGQDHGRRFASVVGLLPAFGAQAPLIARF
jgi:hypothetical protein